MSRRSSGADRGQTAPRPTAQAPSGAAPAAAGSVPVAPPPLPPGADVYAGIVGQSLHLAGIQHGPVEPAVSIVLPPLEPEKIFAGVATALEFGRRLALALGRPLRVVPLDHQPAEPLQAAIRAHLSTTGASVQLSVVPQPLLPHTTVSRDDLWVVTYWTTAHAADVARRIGVLDPARVVYLIQDYEPGFHAWSVPFVLTRATYHAGFHHVINSAPLAAFLAQREGSQANHGLILAPHLDLDRLRAAAAARSPSRRVRVFFYARPSKPRNLYQLGVAAVRAAATRLEADGVEWEVITAGEPHPEVTLPGGNAARGLGTLSWNDYFTLLSEVDVGLTLMHSPHPSHPPLEVAVSGGLTVTNDLDGSRLGFHPRITAVPADPDALAAALVDAVHRARAEGPGPFTPPEEGRLGEAMDTVIAKLLTRLP